MFPRTTRVRLAMAASLLALLIPPTVAYGWTLRRYGSGTTNVPGTGAMTQAALKREYNRAYFEGSGSLKWRVAYRFSPDQGDWYGNESWYSPATMGGSGSFYVYARCQRIDNLGIRGGAWNCDTTVP